MQDDDAYDRGVALALATGKPYYILEVDGWTRDHTGQHPAIPPRDGITRPSSKMCRYCPNSVASVEAKPICALCQLLLARDYTSLNKLASMMEGGMLPIIAARTLVYGSEGFWECIYVPS